MFRWEGCPMELYNQYIEVGEVRESSVKSEECVFIEIWIATVFSNVCHRTECKAPARRPIYGLLKQIRKICGSKPACLIIMSDEACDDTVRWSGAIALLLRQLKKEKLLLHALLYTKHAPEEIQKIVEEAKWRKKNEKELFLSTFELVDGVFYGQAHCYTEEKPQEHQVASFPPALRHFLSAAKKIS